MPYTLLDGIPFYTKEEIDNEFSEGSVSEERARAQAAEQANATAIANEVERAVEADSSLQAQIQDVEGQAEQTSVELASEENRAKAAEQANATAIANEVSRATDAEQDNANAISAERNRALLAEGNLSTAIIEEASRATTAENTKVAKTNLPDKVYGTDAQGEPKLYTADDFADITFIPITITNFPTVTLPEGLYWSDVYNYIKNNKTVVLLLQYNNSTYWFWPNNVGVDQIDYRVFFTCVFVGNGGESRKLYSITQNNTQTRTATLERMDIGERLYAGTGITIETIAGNKRIKNAVSPLVPAEATAQNQLTDKAYVDTVAAAADKIFMINVAKDSETTSGGVTEFVAHVVNPFPTQYTSIEYAGKLVDAIVAGKQILCTFTSYLNIKYVCLGFVYEESTYYAIKFDSIDSNPGSVIESKAFYIKLYVKKDKTEAISVASCKLYALQMLINSNSKLNPSYINWGYNNNGNVLFINVNGNHTTGYNIGTAYATILQNQSTKKALCIGIASDNIFLLSATNTSVLAYPLRTLDGYTLLYGSVLVFDSNGTMTDSYISYTNRVVFVDVSELSGYRIADGTAGAYCTEYVLYGTPQQSITINAAKETTKQVGDFIIRNHSSMSHILQYYSDKQASQVSITIEPDQIVKLYAVRVNNNNTGFICEHTVPLTDANGNTYDVVVRE